MTVLSDLDRFHLVMDTIKASGWFQLERGARRSGERNCAR